MIINYRTNVDCARKFMLSVNQNLADSDPHVGDTVDIYSDTNKVVEMKVVGRKWKYSSLHRQSLLEVELHLTPFWQQAGLDKFEAHCNV